MANPDDYSLWPWGNIRGNKLHGSTRLARLPIFRSMLRIVSPRSMVDERPPVGAAVRLRNHPELTGVVVGDAVEPDRLRVRWDDNDEITDCFAARPEPVRW